jgi:hypothetical protein
MTSFNVVFCRIELNKWSEGLVINLFVFRRFDDHGHHYQEKWIPKEIIQKIKLKSDWLMIMLFKCCKFNVYILKYN